MRMPAISAHALRPLPGQRAPRVVHLPPGRPAAPGSAGARPAHALVMGQFPVATWGHGGEGVSPGLHPSCPPRAAKPTSPARGLCRRAVGPGCAGHVWLILFSRPDSPVVGMRWWSKERHPTSRGGMQVQGLPSARTRPRSPQGDRGLLRCVTVSCAAVTRSVHLRRPPAGRPYVPPSRPSRRSRNATRRASERRSRSRCSGGSEARGSTRTCFRGTNTMLPR